MIRLVSPWYLLLLLPVVALLLWQVRSRQNNTLLVSGPLHRFALSGSWGGLVSRILPFAKALAICLMVIALARPQAGEQKIHTTAKGINIILALDLSESMKAMDFKLDGNMVDRLTAVKSVVADFIQDRTTDRMGMVVFGTHAFTQIPLTRDANALAFMLEHLKIGAAGPNTAIGDAIGISLKRLADVDSASNIIILLTDGQSNAGALPWEDAVKIAAEKKVKIYTIGVGTRGKAPFPVNGVFGGTQFVYRRVSVDTTALKTIAQKTGGEFFKADDTKALEQIYDTINSLEKTETPEEKWVVHRELFPLFLAAGMALYVLHLLLSHTRFLEVP